MNTENLEQIKNLMVSPEVKVISFDVFDTLLLRRIDAGEPFFRLLNRKFRELSDSNSSFGRLRAEAESVLRRRVIRGEWDGEDFLLDDIYDCINKDYGIPSTMCDEMKAEEEFLEHKVSCVRKSGKELYDFALTTGKRVIVTSDMYLSAACVESLLKQAGYGGFDGIFVSSECGLRKITGHLYEYVADKTGAEPGEILHIGDNRSSDIEDAEKAGLRTAWLPSVQDAYMKQGCAHQPEMMCRDLVNWQACLSETGVSIARKMAANMYFDDPFRSFIPGSDYNRDPYFAGYAALGPHVLGLVRWLCDGIKRDGAKKMIFLARDGYLPMQVYNMVRAYHPDLPPAQYLHTSRIALLPVIMGEPVDLYQIPVDKTYHTPEEMLKRLEFCVADDAREKMQAGGRNRNYKNGETFDADSFRGFISDFIACGYDAAKHEARKKIVSDYLLHGETAVEDGCAIFDSGYSGRIASAVAEATGKDIYVYYIHSDGVGSFMNEARGDIKIETFLDFSPYMESTLREYAYLEPKASCIGYTPELEPVFDCGPDAGYLDTAEKLQQGALDFVRDFLETFTGYEKETDCRGLSAAIPFEAFLRYCSEEDRHMFDGVMIDDELWGGRRDIDLNYLMDARISKLPGYAGKL